MHYFSSSSELLFSDHSKISSFAVNEFLQPRTRNNYWTPVRQTNKTYLGIKKILTSLPLEDFDEVFHTILNVSATVRQTQSLIHKPIQ